MPKIVPVWVPVPPYVPPRKKPKTLAERLAASKDAVNTRTKDVRVMVQFPRRLAKRLEEMRLKLNANSLPAAIKQVVYLYLHEAAPPATEDAK